MALGKNLYLQILKDKLADPACPFGSEHLRVEDRQGRSSHSANKFFSLSSRPIRQLAESGGISRFLDFAKSDLASLGMTGLFPQCEGERRGRRFSRIVVELAAYLTLGLFASTRGSVA